MKFYALTAILIAALTALAACTGYWCLRATPAPASTQDSLAWLRQEFALSDAQLAQIEEQHNSYTLICAAHCEAIRHQREQIAQLEAAQAPQPEIAAAIAQGKALDTHCLTSVEAHARQIAAIIGDKQGERYLQQVLPRLARFDHAAAPDLQLNGSKTTAGPTDATQACH